MKYISFLFFFVSFFISIQDLMHTFDYVIGGSPINLSFPFLISGLLLLGCITSTIWCIASKEQKTYKIWRGISIGIFLFIFLLNLIVVLPSLLYLVESLV